jgi:hypothetical protein
VNWTLPQSDLAVSTALRPWACRDRRPLSRPLFRRVGYYRRSGSAAERQKILAIWASLTPWSAYMAQRQTQPRSFPQSWMGRVLLALLWREEG